jgi:hypothetical protein
LWGVADGDVHQQTTRATEVGFSRSVGEDEKDEEKNARKEVTKERAVAGRGPLRVAVTGRERV